MSSNSLSDYFILCFEKKYPKFLQNYDSNNVKYLFDTYVLKYNDIGLNLVYYIKNFVNEVNFSKCNDINIIIRALGEYLSNFNYLKGYPEIVLVVNEANRLEDAPFTNYLESVENTISNNHIKMTDENMEMILKLCPRLKNFINSNYHSGLSIFYPYTNLSKVSKYYLKLMGVVFYDKDYYEKTFSETKIEEAVKPISEPIDKQVYRAIKKRNPKIILPSQGSKQKTNGHHYPYKSLMELIDCNNIDEFNYVVNNLSINDLNKLKGFFGNNFNFSYNSNSESFQYIISRCKVLLDQYHHNIVPKYFDYDFSQNLYYTFKGVAREEIYDAILTLSKEDFMFLSMVYDLKSGEFINNFSYTTNLEQKLVSIFSQIDKYVKSVTKRSKIIYF